MAKPVPKVALARQFRKAPTPPEWLLWERLKSRDVSGFAFRRQHPVGPYILDFYCARARLAIEIDGGMHDAGRDAARDRWLAVKEIQTYRIPAAEVFRDADGVADGVRLLAEERVRERAQKG